MRAETITPCAERRVRAGLSADRPRFSVEGDLRAGISGPPPPAPAGRMMTLVSYDLYLWADADGDVDDVLDALANDDPTPLQRDPRVGAFVGALVGRWPDLADVLETGPDGGGALAYALVTLPFGWGDRAAAMGERAGPPGRRGWAPQRDEPLGGGRDRAPTADGRPGVDGRWTVEDL